MTNHAKNEALRLLALSQLALGGFLLVCMVITPKFLLESNEGGVSNYGVHADTVVPYTLAFSLCSLFLWRSGRAIPPTIRFYRAVRRSFAVMAWLFLLVLVSTYPYKLSPVLDKVHVASAIVLAIAELVILSCMTFLWYPRRWHTVLWLFWFAGFTVSVATVLGALHVLLVGQAATAAGFAALTLTITSKLPTWSGPLSSRAT